MDRPISIFLVGEINPENSKEIVSCIINCNRVVEDKPPFIELYINSQGGPIYYAMSIINAIKESVIPVHTICIGNASSSAAHIFVQGHKGSRTMQAGATLMFHCSFMGYENTSIHVLEAERKHNIFIEDWFNQQLLDNSSMSDMNLVKGIFGTPLPRYVEAEEAIELGMCDNLEVL